MKMMLQLPSTMMTRLLLAFLLGTTFSTAMFWVLWSLVGQPIGEDTTVTAHRIEFSRMRQDTDAANKRDEKPTRVEPPPTPQVRMTPTMANVDASLEKFVVSVAFDTKISPGADTDVIPLVRIPPDYPRRAAQRGIEGWVQVQFTITPTGSVTDAKVVDADPKGMFEEAAIRSILRWRYNPKIEDGQPVERVGVRQVVRFMMDPAEKEKMAKEN